MRLGELRTFLREAETTGGNMTRMAALLLLILSSAQVTADDNFWTGTKPPTRSTRRAIAKQFGADVQRLASTIPNLSPSQQDWVENEITEEIAKAGNRYTAKAITAMDSKEWNIFVARPRLERLLKLLLELTSDSLSARDEAVHWAEVSVYFTDAELWSAVDSLASRGVVDAALLGEHREYFFHNQTNKAQRIITHILLPHLKGDVR